ncbi:hypothetical protein V3C99_010283 [Haemonchus contortus]|uniref:TonB-dependent receptor n=1 Tax=Haemonchus contortus TaxID=6289 RepID=A0A6F7Q9G8_HAECO
MVDGRLQHITIGEALNNFVKLDIISVHGTRYLISSHTSGKVSSVRKEKSRRQHPTLGNTTGNLTYRRELAPDPYLIRASGEEGFNPANNQWINPKYFQLVNQFFMRYPIESLGEVEINYMNSFSGVKGSGPIVERTKKGSFR